MKNQLILITVLLLFLSCGDKKQKAAETSEEVAIEKVPDRYVKDNKLISQTLPEIEIQVAEEFTYAGSFFFEIKAMSEEYPPEIHGKAIAAGDRYVFVAADANKKVTKLFIVQLEGFLPEIEYTYNYNFSTADSIGNNKYRQNIWFYDSAKLAGENPENEGALTRAFLKNKGYSMEDEFMMSRWVGLASKDRKNEIIIYYLEMLKSSTGHSLEEYEGMDKEQAESIRNALVERSMRSFSIVKG